MNGQEGSGGGGRGGGRLSIDSAEHYLTFIYTSGYVQIPAYLQQVPAYLGIYTSDIWAGCIKVVFPGSHKKQQLPPPPGVDSFLRLSYSCQFRSSSLVLLYILRVYNKPVVPSLYRLSS